MIEVLTEQGELRFTRLHQAVPGISYKMLTQTLRSMEREGLVARTVHPVIPPKVEYRLTPLGLTLSTAFCGVWMWAEKHIGNVELARQVFDDARNLKLKLEHVDSTLLLESGQVKADVLKQRGLHRQQPGASHCTLPVQDAARRREILAHAS